ncbi:sensor histidine kinase [Solidesulfovibrio magneticus]|nr:ATP-binding protein [Solidesulfovibrio magneticus]
MMVLVGTILFIAAVQGQLARNQETSRTQAEERRSQLSDMLSFYGETSIRLVDQAGPQALEVYGEQLARTAGVRPFFFIEPDRAWVQGQAPPDVLELARRAWLSGKTEYAEHQDEFLLAKPLRDAVKGMYVVVGKTQLDPAGGAPAPRRPRPEAVEACAGANPGDACSFYSRHGLEHGQCREWTDPRLICVPEILALGGGTPNVPPLHSSAIGDIPGSREPLAQVAPSRETKSGDARKATHWLRSLTPWSEGSLDSYSDRLGKVLAIVFIVSGASCGLLSWRITRPLRRLRLVAQRLAAGDLTVRVDHALNQRGDEIADLGLDIDRMASRIEGLVKTQKRLLRDISHELRSPLARLNVALELARQSAGPSAVTYLDRMERESSRLNELIGQLLTLARLEGEQPNITYEEFDFVELLKEIARDVGFEANSQGRWIGTEICGALRITANRELLRQAIENVVRNAIRHTAPQTGVIVRLAKESESGRAVAALEVQDHGQGVPEEELTNIFLPFYRVASDTTDTKGGAGVGLAISDRAVRLHGGRISAMNACDGGLIVRMILPLN